MRAYKWRRAAFYSCLAAFLLLGLVTGQRLFFLLSCAGILLLLCAYGMDFFTACCFAYTQELSREQAAKGETVTLTVGIYNDMPYPFPRMKVILTGVSSKDEAVFSFDLPARSKIELTYPFPCPYRGEYSAGIREVEIEDVFGLTRIRFSMLRRPYYRQKKLLILPRLLPLPGLPGRKADSKDFSGVRLMPSANGEELAGAREYRPGDQAKRINWKASARRGELLTRAYETPGEGNVTLVLDTFSPAKGPRGRETPKLSGEEAEHLEQERNKSDLLCTCALALAAFHLREGKRVCLLHCSSAKALEYSGPGAVSRLRLDLARLSFSGEIPFADKARQALAGPASKEPTYLLTAQVIPALSFLLSGLPAGPSPLLLLTGEEAPPPLPGGINVLRVPTEQDLAQALKSWDA